MKEKEMKICEQCESETETTFWIGDNQVCLDCYDEATRLEDEFQ